MNNTTVSFSDRSAKGALERGLDILSLLANEERPLGVDAIAQRLRVPKSSVYRILRALRRRGLAHLVSEEKGYYLGLTVLHWADVLQRGLDPVRLAGPVLRTLAQETGETAILTLFDGRRAVTADVMVNATALRVAPPRGRANALHCGAASKAILAWLGEDRWRELVGEEPFRAFTAKTIRDFSRLRADLRAARARGHAISDEEVYEGAKGVGVPIFDERSAVCGSLAIAGPRHRLDDEKVRKGAQLLRAEARTLSSALGFSGNLETSQTATVSRGRGDRKTTTHAGARK
jgi:DNA-binding IclR family transcriptional regulator